MKKSIVLLALCILSVNVSAERNMQSKDGRVSDADIKAAHESVLEQVGITNAKFDIRLYAKGVQIYEVENNIWRNVAPAADMFVTIKRRLTNPALDEKIGFHGIHYATPFWRFMKDGEDIELVAKSKQSVAGAGEFDVDWLYVEVEDNPWGYRFVVRDNTRSGKAPSSANEPNGNRNGIYYETIYSFWK